MSRVGVVGVVGVVGMWGIVALALAAVPVAAQDTPPTAWGRAPNSSSALAPDQAAAWLSAWSPLRPVIDAPRGLLRAPLAPGLLDAPAPRAGAFVLAGAPGALARDLGEGDATGRFGALRVRAAGEEGAFRRPLDVASSRVQQLSGHGYSPVGRVGVAIGRFVVDQEHNARSSYTARVLPYLSAPTVMTDSVEAPMNRFRARLEGALALRLGSYGAGVSLGIESREFNSVNVPLRRAGRASTPAAAVGVERRLPWWSTRLGAYYRWTEPNETNILTARPRSTVIYPMLGLDEPFSLPVSPSTGSVFVRNERRSTARGLSLALRLLGADIVVTHERGQRADDQTQAPFTANRPDLERWRATGSESRAMVQRRLVRRITATLVGSLESLDGEGRRSELRGIAFAGTTTRRAVELDLRTPAANRWSGALILGATTLQQSRTDYAAQLDAYSDVTTPFLSAELSRRVARHALSLGASVASMAPGSARIPAAASRGAVYRRLLAPALGYEVAEASAAAAWLTAETAFRGTPLLLTLRGERTTPTSVVTSRLQPGGNRQLWSVGLAIRP
jgi:hypothetical protein